MGITECTAPGANAAGSQAGDCCLLPWNRDQRNANVTDNAEAYRGSVRLLRLCHELLRYNVHWMVAHDLNPRVEKCS